MKQAPDFPGLTIFELGDVVYQRYSPSHYGKVVETIDHGTKETSPSYRFQMKVKWCSGAVTRATAVVGWGVQSLDGLIADHEKKLESAIECKKKALKL